METILLLLLISSLFLPWIPALIQDQINSQRGAAGSTFQRDLLFSDLSFEADIKPPEFTETFRGDGSDLFNTEVTFEDLQFTSSVDHHQLTVQPLLQAKKNSTVQQHVCGQENVCDDENESERESVQWKDVSTKYDWQNIVALGDDLVVLQAASSLFERNPSVSTLLHYHKGQTLLLKGSGSRLTSDSRVTLVGHGVKGCDGIGRLGGYGAEELARLVSTMGTEIRTVSLVGCELGKDLQFAERLLRELRSLGVESRLHLHSALLSVSLSGETLSKDEEDGVWRLGDDRTKVTAQLDQTGKLLTRVEGGRGGRIVPYYQRQALGKGQGKNKRPKGKGKEQPAVREDRDWPEAPQRFVPEIYQELSFLEALTWAIFKEGDNKECPIFDKVNDIQWKPDNLFQNNKNKVFKIDNMKDVVTEIRYHARKNIEEKSPYVFYKLNDFIYRVKTANLYVHLVGTTDKTLINDKGFLHYKAESYSEIKQALNPDSFHNFCAQTFRDSKCYDNCYQWGHYFMAAVFAESVRNFRQFSLFLLSSAACFFSADKCKTFFDKNPMARGGSWVQPDKRGFYGWNDSNNNNAKEVLDLEKEVSMALVTTICSNNQNRQDNLDVLNVLNGLGSLGGPNIINVSKFENYSNIYNVKVCERRD